jgi:hypothetical protein
MKEKLENPKRSECFDVCPMCGSTTRAFVIKAVLVTQTIVEGRGDETFNKQP